jgi:protein SCO1
MQAASGGGPAAPRFFAVAGPAWYRRPRWAFLLPDVDPLPSPASATKTRGRDETREATGVHMNGTRRRARWRWAALAVLLTAAAYVAVPAFRGQTQAPSTASPALAALDDYGRVPEFALVERSGRPVARGDLLGRVWVATFIYTECPDTCPTQSLELARLQTEFADAADLRLVSITVDPEHDRPEVLARYAEGLGAHPERWLFLTGDRQEIYCLATQGFRLAVVDPAGGTPPACGATAAAPVRGLFRPAPAFASHGARGPIMHSARLVLVDGAARIRAYHAATDPASLAALRTNLRTLLEGR